MSNFPPEWRAQIRQQYLDLGAKPSEIDQIIDLAIHSASEAIETILRVAESAPRHIGVNVIPLALELTRLRCQLAHDGCAETLRASGDTTFAEANFQLGAQPVAAG